MLEKIEIGFVQRFVHMTFPVKDDKMKWVL